MPRERGLIAALGIVAAAALAAALWGADALLGLKVAVAVVFAVGIGAAAVFHLVSEGRSGAEPGWRLALEVLALALCALFVLSRGAPHNDPALYGVYANYGVRGLALAGAALTVCAVIMGGALYRLRGHPVVMAWRRRVSEPAFLWRASAVLAALALLAALEPVVRFWDVPGWGDSTTYDMVAHRIALGLMPAGFSYYMPVYQYGTAFLYYLFGHFFFVQQIANVLLAPATVALLCLSAWNVFRKPWVVLLVGAIATSDDVLRHAPFMQQIENWHIPLLALAVYAATRYFRAASFRNAVWLALAAGLVFEIRTQAAFFVAFLLLAPLFLRDTPARERLRHLVLIGAVFAAVLAPWTIRNYVVDGRLSPVGSQGAANIVYSNDVRTFYGIRRDLAPPAAAAEGKPLPGVRAAIARVLGDPMLLVRAAPWRALAFYGLLPPGVWDKAGPRPTDWAREGKEYLLRVFPVLCLLIAGALGLLLNPGRATLFLTGGVLGNLAVVLFVGFSEPRLSYPSHVLHILLIGAAIAAPRLEFAAARAVAPFRVPAGLPGLAAAALAVMIAAHLTLGRDFAARPLTARPAAFDPGVAIDPGLPDLASLVPIRHERGDGARLRVRKGEKVRAVVALTNQHLPVKYYAFPLEGFPDFSADPATDTYYSAYLVDASGGYDWRGRTRKIAIGFADAVFDRPVREGDVVEVEGEVLDVADWGVLWLHADKLRRLGGPDFGSDLGDGGGAGPREGLK